MNMTEDCISSQPFESPNSFTNSNRTETLLGNCRQSSASPSLSSSEQTHLMMLTQADHHHNHHHLHHHHLQHSFANSHSMAAGHQKQSRSSVSPPNSTVRPFSDLSPGSIVHNGDLFGPIPNLFKWLQLQMTTIEQNLARSKSPSSASPSSPTSSNNSNNSEQLVDIAMNKEEQNLEIIYQQGNYYLEAVHSFRVSFYDSQNEKSMKQQHSEAGANSSQTMSDAKPKAWLAKEIEQKLSLKPGKSWLNGVESYCCLMCNLFSPHSNLLLLHMILTCPKLANNKTDSQQQQSIHSTSDGYPAKDANNNGLRSPNQQQQLNSPTNKGRAPKRSFDIMSLLQQQEITNIPATPEYSRISSDEEGDCNDGDLEEEDSDEKIDVETLEEADCGGVAGDEINRAFGLLKPAISMSEMTTSPLGCHYQSFSNGSRVKTNNIRGANKYPRGKAAKNARVNARTQNSKGAYNGSSRKMKATEPKSLELLYPSSASQFAALQRSKGGGGDEGLVPNSLMPNLANLYSQFGPSLFANTFASFFHPQPSGLNGQHPVPPTLPSSLPHNSNATSSSLLGPALEQVFSSANYPPATSLPPLHLPPPPQSSSLFSPTTASAHHFGGSLSTSKYPGNQHSPSSSVKGGGMGAPYHNHHHHRSQHPFEHQSLSSGGHGSSSLVTASNSPSSTLSDSQSGGSPASGSSSTNSANFSSLSPCISISPKSEYDQISAGTTTGSSKRNNDHHHHTKESGKLRKSSHHHHHHQNRSSQSPTPLTTAASTSGALQNSSSSGSQLNLPPYFLPPSSTASNPLISSMYLLSPSLTALSYQASNVCAYCGTAFRMTSDLVYHMRSHHKKMARGGEGVDGSGGKKRRNDALKCNICQETFRERHHLTRHMTSHQ